MTCNDCICNGGACRFVVPNEQPYFQAFRLARRIPFGEVCSGFEFIIWIGGQWRDWRAANGLTPHAPVNEDQRAAFQRWLFASVGHPAARA